MATCKDCCNHKPKSKRIDAVRICVVSGVRMNPLYKSGGCKYFNKPIQRDKCLERG